MSLARKRYVEWLDRMRAQQKPLVSYRCPRCDAEIFALKPEDGERAYTSFVSCPDCGRLHHTTVHSDGRATLKTMEAWT